MIFALVLEISVLQDLIINVRSNQGYFPSFFYFFNLIKHQVSPSGLKNVSPFQEFGQI